MPYNGVPIGIALASRVEYYTKAPKHTIKEHEEASFGCTMVIEEVIQENLVRWECNVAGSRTARGEEQTCRKA